MMRAKITEGIGLQSTESSVEKLIAKWKKKPEQYFVGQTDKKLKWGRQAFGIATLERRSESHGIMVFPDMKVLVTFDKEDYTLGWVEGISMLEGGIVRIRHFAINEVLEGHGHGIILYNSILKYFKNKNAIYLEFHENHTKKIDRYRKFFDKQEVKKIEKDIWRVDIYPKGHTPIKVRIFQSYLKMKGKLNNSQRR